MLNSSSSTQEGGERDGSRMSPNILSEFLMEQGGCRRPFRVLREKNHTSIDCTSSCIMTSHKSWSGIPCSDGANARVAASLPSAWRTLQFFGGVLRFLRRLLPSLGSFLLIIVVRRIFFDFEFLDLRLAYSTKDEASRNPRSRQIVMR